MFSNSNSKENQRKNKFLAVFPELELISKAPVSVMQVQGFFGIEDPKERDRFEQAWLDREATKFYKALDGAGGVWKMRNPALSRHPWLIDTTKPIKYPPKEFLGNLDDMKLGAESYSTTKEDSWR